MEKEIPVLNAIEQRVLGALIEKSKTTPDYYPMSLNALTAACNQKSSRKPVVNYEEETVQNALNSLKAQSLVSTAVGGSIRTAKYKHNFTTVYALSDKEMAVLCLLLLRGPLTPGEINSNSGRLYEFSSLDSVVETLRHLNQYSSPYVKELPRRAGQKEGRFVHLIGPVEEELYDDPGSADTAQKVNPLEARVSALEQELEQVKLELKKVLDFINS
jgi:uncharacterized protein